MGLAIAGAVLFGMLASLLEGCEIDTSIGDPGRGTASEQLDVLVAPATELAHDQEVRVASRAFAPNAIVGVAVCLAEAATARLGVDACDEAQGARFAVDADGVLAATYRVPRVISVDGAIVDCATSARRCLLVAADANDYDRSGGQPISFDSSEPAPTLDRPGQRPQTDALPIAATPAGPVAPEATVQLEASGFQPGEPLLVAWCTSAFATEGPTACEPRDSADAIASIGFRSLPDDPAVRADGGGRVSVSVTAKGAISPFGGSSEEPGPADPTDADGRASTTTDDAPSVACTGEPGRCWFVIAAAADTKRSAVLPYDLVVR